MGCKASAIVNKFDLLFHNCKFVAHITAETIYITRLKCSVLFTFVKHSWTAGLVLLFLAYIIQYLDEKGTKIGR